MTWLSSLILLGGGLGALLITGIPVALAFFGINLVGAWVFLGGEPGLMQVVRNSVGSVANYTLAPIPLFILMGEVLLHTGLAFRAIDAIERLISRVPGRMPLVAVAGGTVFAALSGSSIANTAMLGKALLPSLLGRGYHPTLAMGPIMATGAIAMLIPPSALAVLVGSLAGISIAKLLIAGIVPALMLSVLFAAYIIVRAIQRPQDAPAEQYASITFRERIGPFLLYVVPLSGIVIVVVGSLIAGLATPTESAALGALATMLAAMLYRSFTMAAMMRALHETAMTVVMIMFIIVASSSFSQLLTFSGASHGIVTVLQAFDPTPFKVMLGMMLILLVLGCFVDQVSMAMITIPIFLPVAAAVDINLLWLGVIYLLAMEVSFLTPPFGLLLFVMKGVAPPHLSMKTIYYAAAPFVMLELFVLAAVLLFPELGLWLPSLMTE
ncbi:TRAP transporter large permease [Pusillimonas noertemannii]|uniref:TRAP transporter large permease protein n=1 Tax=Pusillimonas noertemannii TaxID=305977 RepID=A0A2U1CL17_9BURK|nr:TRAP transporter large permease subunit [Pusillimonas noertemannii]NYT69228.1 TRAP transporter large permease subunit [Pusillimonas noertemannii]PVY61697.1 tripartite ATP-independent transporter DctM subunit [Pusillimonas noertemannii]TFL09637.1 TRAP transporter large permease subunit [Pusillimonas noertemannii]